jgi:hypothetical protein
MTIKVRYIIKLMYFSSSKTCEMYKKKTDLKSCSSSSSAAAFRLKRQEGGGGLHKTRFLISFLLSLSLRKQYLFCLFFSLSHVNSATALPSLNASPSLPE